MFIYRKHVNILKENYSLGCSSELQDLDSSLDTGSELCSWPAD